ncbi:hypothetical protein TNCV_1213621 [Trichonephila clavipes]|nr:hypothetical protein TNCV_1213621 [Trichonephila clavipes]
MLCREKIFSHQAGKVLNTLYGHFGAVWGTGKEKKTKYLKEFLPRDYVQSLEDEVPRRFHDFKKTEPKFNLLCYTINADIDTSPEELQLEVRSQCE